MTVFETPRLISWLCLAAFVGASAVTAEEPLHVQIDQLIESRADGPLSERCSDAEFLRRVYLDFTGRIPSVSETRAYLDDRDSDRRERLVDRLLSSGEYPRRMAECFDVMLMERLGEHDEWREFLRLSFAENKPWDQMAREILHPRSDSEPARGAAFFYTKRLENYGQNPVDMPGLVRDVGRLFLGMDLQCAECHDHLFVDEYKQDHYQGLLAFVGHTFIRRDVAFPAVGEKLVEKKIPFKSVFVMQDRAIGPRLPGLDEVPIPEFDKDEQFAVPPDKKSRFPGVPRFSPLKILAEQLPAADNRAFKRNIANRLWWLMMGRGLVHPLDLHHGDNPPSHPELLQLLADELAAHNFDIRWTLRELALSEAYQRSGRLPAGGEMPPITSYRTALERPLSAEQLLASLQQATGAAVPITNERDADLLGRFQKAFANPPRDPEVEINPTVKAALFLLNDEVVQGWFKPHGQNLVARLADLENDAAVADELYLAVLTRFPTDEERAEVDQYLKTRMDRRVEALGNLAWSMAASVEFAVNH